jgi:hypothetical protein
MSINLVRRQYGGTPQHPTLFGVEFGNNQDVIYWLQGTTVPGREIKHGVVPWMNGEYHYPTRTVGAGTWNANFYVFEDMEPMKWLYSWYKTIFDWQTGKYGTRNEVATDATVFLMNTDASQRTISFTMHHCMLTKIGDIRQLSYETTDAPISVECEFAFEDFDISFNTNDGLGS